MTEAHRNPPTPPQPPVPPAAAQGAISPTTPSANPVAAAHHARHGMPHRRGPIVCIVLNVLILISMVAGSTAFWNVLNVRLPGLAQNQVYPQNVFDAAWSEAIFQGEMGAGGLTLESVGADHQFWRILTVNLASPDIKFFYPQQQMSTWLLALFVLFFIWLCVNIYEMVLGSLRAAGLLLVAGLGAGIVATFYHAGLPYGGLLSFFPAVSLAFLFGSFRWKAANRAAGDPYFIPLDLMAIAVQCFLCFFFMSTYSFVMIPSIAGGVLAGTAYMYCVPPAAGQKTGGIYHDPRMGWGFVGLAVVLLAGIIWCNIDAGAHAVDPARRTARLGFGPQDQIVIGYNDMGAIHIATGGSAVAPPVPPPPTIPPPPKPETGTRPLTPDGVGSGTPPPPPTNLPDLTAIDPAHRQAVFDFDSRIARGYYEARSDLVMQLQVAGWPSEMQTVVSELHLAENLNAGFDPIAACQTDLPGLQALIVAMQTEKKAYGDWLDQIAKAPDDNLLTRTGIRAARKKAEDLTDQRRKQFATLAANYAIKTVPTEFKIGVPVFKPSSVYMRSEEFRTLYDLKIRPVDAEIDTWLNRLQQYGEKPVEMKNWIVAKNYIKQLTEFRAAVANFQAQDAKNREYQQAFLAESQALIDYFQFICDHSPDNERLIWRSIEEEFNKALRLQAARRALETNLIERFNFTNE